MPYFAAYRFSKASGALRQRGKERKINAPPAGGWRLFPVVRSACVPCHRETLMPTREDSQQHKLLSDSSCLVQLFEKFQNSSLPCFNTGPGRKINCSLTSCLSQLFEEFQNSSLPVTNTVEKDSMLQHRARARDKLLSDCNCLAQLLQKNQNSSLPVANTIQNNSKLQHRARVRDEQRSREQDQHPPKKTTLFLASTQERLSPF